MIPPILLVGCGRMGGAMLAGWQEQGLAPSLVVDPARPTLPAPHQAVAALEDIPDAFRPAAIVLAVKPQNADQVLPALAPLAANAVTLSIMAGRTLDGIARHLPGAALVRAMPNTPAAIRQGITVAVAAPTVTADQRSLCDTLLAAIGQVAWVDDEALLDPVTAISGSGPAYVFLLAELLEREALHQGIPPDLARRMARQTITGAGNLLAASPEDAGALRVAVTSPGGTTEKALAILMADWPASLRRAIQAATDRSRALAG